MRFLVVPLFLALIAFSVVSAGSVDPLEECFDNIKEDYRREAELEIQLDQLKKDFEAARANVDVFQWYRDDNRTDAMSCLVNLTVCNNENDFKTMSVGGESKRYAMHLNLEREAENHKVFKSEDKLKSRVASLDKRFKKGMKLTKKSKNTREALDCNLEQCRELREKSFAYVHQLENAVAKYAQILEEAQYTIMAWTRYSILYFDLLNSCIATLAKCESGLRNVRISYINGAGEYFDAAIAAWAGLAPESVSFADSEASLENLSAGDADAIGTEFVNENNQALSVAHFPANDSTIEDGESVVVGHIDASESYHTHLSFAASLVNSNWQVSVDQSFTIFDASGNFIHDDGGAVKRSKRYNWPVLDCDAEGHPLPFAERHIRTFLATHVVGENNTVSAAGYAKFIVEELRWVAPLPSSIPDLD